ncbi:MAG: SDR family oxidoreductase [Cyclobacteriaceae bacterium]
MSINENNVIWITGASSGIGEALALELSKKPVKLILSARRESELLRVRDSCLETGKAQIMVLPLDLADAESLPDKTKEAEYLFGKVDILINNGGISQRDMIINTSMEVDRKLMEVNYFGSIALSKYLLPKMVERKSGHHVIVTSAVGIISTPKRSAYSASKHALHGFYDALRAEHHLDNIKVTIVCPGYVKTNISYNALMGNGKRQNKLDNAQANGLTSEYTAKKIIAAINQEKQEVYIGGFKEKLGIYMKRFFPYIYSVAVRKMAVT